MVDKMEVDDQTYQVIEDFKNGFEKKAFVERYSDILSKYDFIVGDWGYDQLRLKGFFDDNFGCAYFIVKRIVQ